MSSLLRGACSIWRGKRTSVAGVGRRAIGAEPDTRTPVNATGIMHTTPVYTQTNNQHVTGTASELRPYGISKLCRHRWCWWRSSLLLQPPPPPPALSVINSSSANTSIWPNNLTIRVMWYAYINAQWTVDTYHKRHPFHFLTVLHWMQGGVVRRKLSVHPSVKRMYCDKVKKNLSRFLYHMKDHLA